MHKYDLERQTDMGRSIVEGSAQLMLAQIVDSKEGIETRVITRLFGSGDITIGFVSLFRGIRGSSTLHIKLTTEISFCSFIQLAIRSEMNALSKMLDIFLERILFKAPNCKTSNSDMATHCAEIKMSELVIEMTMKTFKSLELLENIAKWELDPSVGKLLESTGFVELHKDLCTYEEDDGKVVVELSDLRRKFTKPLEDSTDEELRKGYPGICTLHDRNNHLVILNICLLVIDFCDPLSPTGMGAQR
ncbi:hypothetical protein M9H77_30737 [Catharanthus roseus]|uniref:Uncharacterized protein n=1 Tax=Catharanthus roseus TaxID=4058 RepID=A0ACB9ZZ57_CATRO|nr:hypothetical protein M9H77_30737 [Catharanthus roseus]